MVFFPRGIRGTGKNLWRVADFRFHRGSIGSAVHHSYGSGHCRNSCKRLPGPAKLQSGRSVHEGPNDRRSAYFRDSGQRNRNRNSAHRPKRNPGELYARRWKSRAQHIPWAILTKLECQLVEEDQLQRELAASDTWGFCELLESQEFSKSCGGDEQSCIWSKHSNAAHRFETNPLGREIEILMHNPLPLGEGAKREPDRAKPQVKVRVQDLTRLATLTRRASPLAAALSQREREPTPIHWFTQVAHRCRIGSISAFFRCHSAI